MKDTLPRLKKKYRDEIIKYMMKEFKYKNVMQVPKLEKIVLNMGMGEAIENKKILETGVEEMALISGQKPVKIKGECLPTPLTGEGTLQWG